MVNKAAVGRKATRLAQAFKKGNLAGFELGDLYNEYPPYHPKGGRTGKKSAETAVFTVEWWEQHTGLSARRLQACAQAARECTGNERGHKTVDMVLREIRGFKSEEDLEEDEIRTEARKKMQGTGVDLEQHPDKYDESRDELKGKVMEMAAAGRSVEEIAEELEFDKTSFSRQDDLVEALLEVRPGAMSRRVRPDPTCENRTATEAIMDLRMAVATILGVSFDLCEDDLEELRSIAKEMDQMIRNHEKKRVVQIVR
jgi:hypothetical protein